MNKPCLISWIIILTTIVWGCEPKIDTHDFQPVADYSVSQDSGNTTTIFSFDASESTGQGLEDNPVFVRWDWESDGIWDKPFSTTGMMTHRFFDKGTYRISLEAVTLLGKKDTLIREVHIEQGYSPPRPRFTIDPDSANIFNTFQFDASLSKDDEDSLSKLEFRWDFENDNLFDTDWAGQPFITHSYTQNQTYLATLEVRDPQHMTAVSRQRVVVTRLNDKIEPRFTIDCWPCTLEDTIRLDATSSFIRGDRDASLRYSWDISNDNLWEVIESQDPHFESVISKTGKSRICLRVTDEKGLYMDLIQEIEIYPLNEPPVANLTLANRYGNLTTEFFMLANKSFDRTASLMDLLFEWDTNNDGVYEQKYRGLMEITCRFNQPGAYPIHLCVTDPLGKSDISTDTILVMNSTRPTSLIKHKLVSGMSEYYGAVKIGDRWWMQSNTRYLPPEDYTGYAVAPYDQNDDNLKKYGALYSYHALRDGSFNPCPKDWRITSVQDWEELLADLGHQASFSSLAEGGDSEIHLLYAGQGNPSGSVFQFIDQLVNYWTMDDNRTGQTYVWYIDPGRKQNRKALMGRSFLLPIRCVQD